MDFFLGDWVKIGNKEYCFNSNTLIWNDAKAFCMTEGGKLFEPRDAQENSAVTDYAFSNELRLFWIGIQDEPVSPEGTWVYASDGSPLEYTNWNQGEPNNSGDEDCGEIGYFTGNLWNDYKCATLLGSVCEKSGSPPPTTGGNFLYMSLQLHSSEIRGLRSTKFALFNIYKNQS